MRRRAGSCSDQREVSDGLSHCQPRLEATATGRGAHLSATMRPMTAGPGTSPDIELEVAGLR